VKTKVSAEAWWTLAVLSFFCLLSFVDRYILTMLVRPIQADLGIGDFEMGLILGPAFGVMLGLFGLPLGYLVDRWSRRSVVFLGVSFWSVATMSCGLAQSAASLFMSRVGVGAGEATLGPAVTSLLADKFPRDRLSTALGIYNAGMKLGQAAAFGVGGILLGVIGTSAVVIPVLGALRPWQLVFILAGLPGLFGALLAFTFSEPRRTGRQSSDASKSPQLWQFLKGNRGLMLLMYGGFAVVALVAYSLTAWVPTYVSRRFGWEPEHYGPALAVVNIAAAAALILKGSIVDWIYGRGGKDAPVRFYSWLLIATTPLALGVFFVPSPWVFFGIYTILQVVTIPSMMYLSASLALLAPNELRGQLSALAFTLYSILGLGLGPTLVGALTDFVFKDQAKIGLSLALVLGAGVPVGAVMLRMAMKPLRVAVARAEGFR
jgi:MFS family permease